VSGPGAVAHAAAATRRAVAPRATMAGKLDEGKKRVTAGLLVRRARIVVRAGTQS
jgi:hypothetical protein